MTYEQDIKTLLTIGENIVIEFKRAGNGPEHDTFESICAFLNRQGGDVLLGVTDDGKVIGLPPKAAPAMVRQIVNVMNDPNLWEPRIAVYPDDWRETVSIPVKTDRRKAYLRWHNKRMAEADEKSINERNMQK